MLGTLPEDMVGMQSLCHVSVQKNLLLQMTTCYGKCVIYYTYIVLFKHYYGTPKHLAKASHLPIDTPM